MVAQTLGLRIDLLPLLMFQRKVAGGGNSCSNGLAMVRCTSGVLLSLRSSKLVTNGSE